MATLKKIRTATSLTLFKINWKCRFSSTFNYDIVVIGGGIIGTAIAKTLKEEIKEVKIALIEKENDVGQHQSSHNSNVIHAGIYYETDSLKAKLCVEGMDLIYKYCENKNIPVKRCGKLIIATNVLDTYRLNVLYKRGLKNKVPGLKILKDLKDVYEIQPHCKSLQSLWSPNTGNVDWELVTKYFCQDFKNAGGDVYLNREIKNIKESTDSAYPIVLEDNTGSCFLTKYVVSCLGLYSGKIFDCDDENFQKKFSLKVRYRFLHPNLSRFIKTNIYAMPCIDMPFLGIHFSPTLKGNILVGPSAVPALKLDDYKNSMDFSYMRNNVFSKGFVLMFLKNFWTNMDQVAQTACGDVQAEALREYLPMISKNDLLPGPSGVLGQILKNDGEFVDDFLIDIFQGVGIGKRIVNCKFIPSPGATCSLAIANMITKEIKKVYLT